VVQHFRTRRPVFALVTFAVMVGTSGRAPAQGKPGPEPVPPAAASPAGADELIRLSRNVPGDSKPITLNADSITTWTEDGRRVFLLQGLVLVEQGVVQARFRQGVVWVDLDRLKRTKILHADVYAEGDVRVQSAAEGRTGSRAILDLNTRGELRMKAQNSKVVQQSAAADPLYKRGLVEITPPPPPPPIQRTSAQELSPPSPPPSPTPAPGPAALPVQRSGPAAPGPAPGSLLPPGGGPPVPSPGPPPAGPSAGVTPPLSAPGPPAPPTTAPAPETAPPPRPAPGATIAPAGPAPPRVFSIAPRTAAPFQSQIVNLPNGDQALVVTGGVILNVRNVEKIGLLDIEADRLVLWTKGSFQQLNNNIQKPDGHTGRELEIYMAGNVELREHTDNRPATPGGPPPGLQPGVPPSPDQPGATPPASQPGVPPPANRGPIDRTLRADEVYYDVSRNVAIAVNADLEIHQPGIRDPLHFRGIEVRQLSPTQFQSIRAQTFASKLPSDPGLDVYFDEATLEEKRVPRRGLFGTVINPKTGEPVIQEQDIVEGRSVFIQVEGVPIFWVPWARFDARDPLGPVRNISVGYNNVFGFQANVSLNLYDLLGLVPQPGSRWTMDVDYLSLRGPALGTQFDQLSPTFFGLPARDSLLIKAWGINDTGTDVLGGGRGQFDNHPDWRGWFLYRQNVQELPLGFSIQAQASALSDQNFLEQYYKLTFDNDINQETFVYLKQSPEHANWAWTLLAEPNIRNWVDETEWLPRADGYLIGESFFNVLTYSAHADVGYAHLLPTQVPPPPESLTTKDVATGRFDLSQELSLPFYAGPVKVVPYGVLDLTDYTEDLAGQNRGRIYGGGGVRASIPFTRLYPEIQSEWFNLNGINHKITVTGNYFVAQSDTPFTDLPQLDRLNDDATDQSIRDIKPLEPLFNPAHGLALATSPIYDPQLFAIRRLVENRVDTLDDIEVVQADVYQRWQTKRGYPGQEHIIDWMTLDLSAWAYPHSQRDDFGHTLGFLEYNWLWNVGDRNGFVSSGWAEPFTNGARVFNFGAFFDRPDHTNLYLGYRQIDPVDSRLVIASLTAVLSPKYAITASTAYDFGTSQAQSNTLILTRMGSDLQVSLGVSYDAITKNFGVLFEIVPNVVAETRHTGPVQAVNPSGTGLLAGH
jgi:hypothetical protein